MDELRYYQGEDGWRWQLIAPNEKLIAESGEAYATESNCKRALERLKSIDMAAVPVIKAYKKAFTNG